MRWLFTLVGGLLVLYVVLQLGKTQVQSLQPAAGAASGVPQAAQKVQQDLQKALAAGMQQRASDADTGR